MNLRTIFAAAVAALGLVQFAAAADIAAKAPVYKAPVAPAFSWTGFYVGATAGGGWGDPHHAVPAGASPDFTMKGAVGGATVGFNWQYNQLVLGVEGDWSWSGIDGNTVSTAAFGCGPANICETDVRSFATLRGRAGIAFDRWLVFGTGGTAWTRLRGVNPPSDSTTTYNGWTAGGGVEYALFDHISLKVEYLHVQVGDFNYDNTLACGVPGCATYNNSFDVVRGGVNWRF